MSDQTRHRDADKSRQELLNELCCLRDVAGEREQMKRELEQQTQYRQQRLAKLAAACEACRTAAGAMDVTVA